MKLTSTRVVVVDDDPATRALLTILAEYVPGVRVVGEAEDGDKALAVVSAFQPNIVLMDVKMPRVDGVTATEVILKDFPKTLVLMVSGYTDMATVKRAMKAGACGYVVKDNIIEELYTAIECVLDGRAYLSPVLSG